MIQRFAALLLRFILPACILAGGWYGFRQLSIPMEEEVVEPPEPTQVRSRVQPLEIGSYQVYIETNGLVSAHDQVTLSAEVTGRVVKINPEFEVGCFFSAGDVLLKIDDRDYKTAIRIAEQEVRRSGAASKLAMTAKERMEQLAAQDGASLAELESARSLLLQAENDVEIAKANLDQAERDLERTEIVAPFSGRVVTKLIGPGELITVGTTLGDVFAVDYAEVRLPVATRELQFLSLPERESDQPLDVTFRDSINPDNEAEWSGQIVRTEGALDPNSLELFAIARIPDPFGLHRGGPALRIGQPVSATIRGEKLKDVVAIPRGSVRSLNQVHVIDSETKKLSTLNIDPLWSDDSYVIVRDTNIRPGDFVATTMLVYAPEGAIVDIISELETESLAGQPATGSPTP
ncbi:MAG: efflux transporter periplasmic adaptor subunit [Planctomycetaceae bacterium TMED240]|nr:efflux transporter periplasmic adaptor subunit [Rhodopirellula sp.]OUX07969.1 MAG: efflux transporter periplasmic adaptor subunit [Planctomycetaceae bacterium TMED240]